MFWKRYSDVGRGDGVGGGDFGPRATFSRQALIGRGAGRQVEAGVVDGSGGEGQTSQLPPALASGALFWLLQILRATGPL